MKINGSLVALTLLQAFSMAGPLYAQSLPFEEKAKYERALEQKVDEVLVRLLGPNQAKVVVDATMDFSRSEKVEVTADPAAGKDAPFKWQGAGGSAQSGDYLMPGFPSLSLGGGESKAYNRQMVSPSAFVKKLAVSIIINRGLSDPDAENVRRVVSEMLLLDQKRGDQLAVIKAPFAPLWRTIWYTPEAISLVLKYVMLSLMSVVGMIVVAVGFLKLAGAMSAMAKVQQSHQITMELGKGGVPGGPEGVQPGPAPGGTQALPSPETGMPEVEAEGQALFSVKVSQVPFLTNLMMGEDPANVALVAQHLLPEVRTEFLKQLPSAFASDVVINMSKIRFVEPEIITTLKDELERRLSGAIGGVDGALNAIESVNLRARKLLLEDLDRKQPELAAAVRKRLLFPEDLALLGENEISLMVSVVKTDEWATAMPDLPDAVRQKIRAQMADKTWQMIEQSMSGMTPPADKIEAAVEQIMGKVVGLIRDGRIADPRTATKLLDNEQEGAAAA